MTTPTTRNSVLPPAERLASDAEDGAAKLAMAVESIADEVDVLARQLAELRADVARQRLLVDELRKVAR